MMPSTQTGREVYITKLKESLDWTPWIRGIKSLAKTHEIWDYIDPDRTLVLTEPVDLSWSGTVAALGPKPMRTAFPDNEAGFARAKEDYNERLQEAKEEFRHQEKINLKEYDRYKAKKKAIMQIEEVIKNSISEGLQGETLIQQSARDKIKEQAEVIMDSRDLGVSTINNTRIRQDFLKSIEEWDIAWAAMVRAIDLLLQRSGQPETEIRIVVADFKREVGIRKKPRL
ncbi:hypothetical protein HRG_003341 [Hirsutella rhossiliensis]|uniref:Uncharacterized protein n=1 Tax=Hirsutella rhossiliensis TaxID=111463 RepID=A0A9P8N1U3_9HYPO|nr:uncharacterized protein HRG_03341 [Hirsutella rhossiliensis]KAH0965325.1 hypothetical protein HRG_03341 [Hirsutella rhossiliensis]